MNQEAAAPSALVLGGKNGLLGQALTHSLRSAGWKVFPAGREDFDPFDRTALGNAIEQEQCSVVFNTIAYTAVDLAEENEADAYRLNKALPQIVGEVCRSRGAKLVHYSTDFVFDGKKDTPYTTEDAPCPESVYGASKLAGEQALLGLSMEDLLIIRISWLFGPGKINFVEKILSLCSERESLSVVADQTGSPSYTLDLAENSRILVEKGGTGLFHLASSGKATWCELAAEACCTAGLGCVIEPICSEDFPQKAKRPHYSVLDLSKFEDFCEVKPRPWIQALRDYIYQDLRCMDGK